MRTIATRKLIAAAATTLAVGVTLTGCSSTVSGNVASDCKPASTFTTLKQGTLSIVGPDYPPLFTYEGNKLDGVDGQIMAGFAEANCLTTSVKVLPAAGVIEAVKGGQADIAGGGWFPTEERAKIVNQTQPIYADPAVLVGKSPSSDLESYKGKAVGTTQGYFWVDDLQKWGGDDIKLYSSPDAVFQDLVAGRIDIAVMASNEAAFRLRQAPADAGLTQASLTPTEAIPATTTPAVTNLPHTKDNNDLTKALDTYVTEIRGNGKLAEILKQANIDVAYADPKGA